MPVPALHTQTDGHLLIPHHLSRTCCVPHTALGRASGKVGCDFAMTLGLIPIQVWHLLLLRGCHALKLSWGHTLSVTAVGSLGLHQSKSSAGQKPGVPAVTPRRRPSAVPTWQQDPRVLLLAHACQPLHPVPAPSSQGAGSGVPSRSQLKPAELSGSLPEAHRRACPHCPATLPHVLPGLSDEALWKLINVTAAGVTGACST